MKSRLKLLSLAVLLLAALRCSTTSGDSMPLPSEGFLERDRYLVDPRTGYTPGTPAIEKRFTRATMRLNEGRVDDAEHIFKEIARANPEYRPAILALARLAYDRAEYDQALQLVERSEEGIEPFTAAEIYRAEIAIAQGKRDVAYDIYRRLNVPGAPETVRERTDELQKEVFEDLFARATRESGESAIQTLREALSIRESEPARILLAQQLIAAERFEEARTTIAPLMSRAGERDDIMAIAAEIDMSRGDYQSAITRFDRLARKHPDAEYGARLAEAKARFSAANMPPQFRKAFESPALSRSDLATLIYWKVSPVRFATNVGQPPIAVDISSIPGREEFIRSLALGFFSVDPITREADPNRTVSPQTFLRIINRLVMLRGTPSCAGSLAPDLPEANRAQQILDACGVDVSAVRSSTDGVSGRVAADVLERVDRALSK